MIQKIKEKIMDWLSRFINEEPKMDYVGPIFHPDSVLKNIIEDIYRQDLDRQRMTIYPIFQSKNIDFKFDGITVKKIRDGKEVSK